MDRSQHERRFFFFALSLVALGAILVSLQVLTGGSRARAQADVDICHALGNGEFNLITIDDDAVQAHLDHGDFFPVDGSCEVVDETTTPEASPTATGTTEASVTATGTTEASVTATNTVEASSTATDTPVPTETATEVPVTSAAGVIVTNTPVEVVSGAQGGANATETATTAPAATSAVSGAVALPSTGTAGTGGGNDGMLFFGIGLIVLGSALAGSRLLLSRR